jgi:hypothetical protein
MDTALKTTEEHSMQSNHFRSFGNYTDKHSTLFTTETRTTRTPGKVLIPATTLVAVCMGSTLAYAAYMKEFDVEPGHLRGVGVESGRTSWFGQFGYGKYNNGKHRHVWRDTGDNGKNASGLPQTHPGIAMLNRKTLKHWFEVELNGKVFTVQQVDIGPAKWTGRVIDINAPLADMAGYTPKNFPTDSVVKYRYIGKHLPARDDNRQIAEEKNKLPKLALLDLEKSDKSKLEPWFLERLEEHKIVKAPEKKLPSINDRKHQIVGKEPWGLHPVIKTSMYKASRHLPEGYKVRFNNAGRNSSSVGSASYHIKRDKHGALAVDIEILDPKGRVLRNLRSPAHFAMYRDFMHWTKKYQYDDYPAYRGRGRWGGYFVSGVDQDLMHYDLGPENSTQAGNWEHGLKKQYAYFGRPGDVGKGMGKIAQYQLPGPFGLIGDVVTAVPRAIVAGAEATMADRAVTARMGSPRHDRPHKKKRKKQRVAYADYDYYDDSW